MSNLPTHYSSSRFQNYNGQMIGNGLVKGQAPSNFGVSSKSSIQHRNTSP